MTYGIILVFAFVGIMLAALFIVLAIAFKSGSRAVATRGQRSSPNRYDSFDASDMPHVAMAPGMLDSAPQDRAQILIDTTGLHITAVMITVRTRRPTPRGRPMLGRTPAHRSTAAEVIAAAETRVAGMAGAAAGIPESRVRSARVPRYKLTIAYEGTNFCGWQKQFPHEDSVPTAPRLLPAEGAALSSRDSDTAHEQISTSHIKTEPGNQASGSEVQCADAAGRPRVELRTVQSVVERALRYVVREPIVLHGASRTDAGVHARGQVGAFTCSDTGGREGGWPVDRGLDTLCRAINARLPDDVLIVKAQHVADDFNPIADCQSKGYSYALWTGRDRPLWERRHAMHIWQELDAPAMDAAARLFEGEHDFAAFAAAGHGRATTVRTVFSCRVRRDSPERVVMDISGNGFLWNMVRIIAGTLVEAGKGGKGAGGKMSATRIAEALRSGDRRLAGPTLPPNGLCLEWIKYRDAAPDAVA